MAMTNAWKLLEDGIASVEGMLLVETSFLLVWAGILLVWYILFGIVNHVVHRRDRPILSLVEGFSVGIFLSFGWLAGMHRLLVVGAFFFFFSQLFIGIFWPAKDTQYWPSKIAAVLLVVTAVVFQLRGRESWPERLLEENMIYLRTAKAIIALARQNALSERQFVILAGSKNNDVRANLTVYLWYSKQSVPDSAVEKLLQNLQDPDPVVKEWTERVLRLLAKSRRVTPSSKAKLETIFAK